MTDTKTIKVLSVDDSADIVAVLELAIDAEADMSSVGCLTDLGSIEAAITQHLPDVVLLDLSMPGYDSIQVIRSCARKHPQVRFIVFSGDNDPRVIDSAMEAGAWGFVAKDREVPQLLAAIRTVAGGQVAVAR